MDESRLLIYNAEIITLNEKLPNANWVYIADGFIRDVGVDDGYKKYDYPCACIDLKGKTLLPGFFDSHVHLVQSGLNILSNNISECKSIEEVLDSLKYAKVKPTEVGEMIMCIGIEENKLKEQRMPNRWEIDSIISNKIVWISRVDYHVSIFNSLGLRILNLPFNLKGIQRDEKGVPTGVLTDVANVLARKKMLEIISDKIREEGVKIVLDEAIQKGVTTINAMEGGFLFHDRDAEFVHRNLTSFPIDVELFYQTPDLSKVEDMGLNKGGGCIFLDGTIGARTAAVYDPYRDKEDGTGELYFSDYELENLIFESIRKGFYTSVHAIGDRAIDQILSAYSKAKNLYPNSSGRMRIERFVLANEKQINRAINLGVIFSMHPTYAHYWGGKGKMYETRLGEVRRDKTNPLGSIVNQGGIVAGGSDSDVTPIDPLLGIFSAVNHPTKSQRVEPFEALKMFTINGAIAIGQQDIKGKVQKGYLADLCVLEKNPLKVNQEEIKHIKITMTIKTGKVIYEYHGTGSCGDEHD